VLKLVCAELKSSYGTFFVVKCEEVCTIGKTFPFLDAVITVEAPFFAVTALQEKYVKPLSPSSAHPPSVHRSWPQGVANRVHILSGGNPQAKSILIDRYAKAGADASTLGLLECWQPLANPSSAKRNGEQSLPLTPFIFRYHPVFRRALRECFT